MIVAAVARNSIGYRLQWGAIRKNGFSTVLGRCRIIAAWPR
jgi:hypothetical protein